MSVDLFDINSLLSEEEQMVRDNVSRFVDDNVKPIIQECFESHSFPKELIKPIAEIKNKTQPIIFIILLFIYQLISNFLFSHIDLKTLNIKGNSFSLRSLKIFGPISNASSAPSTVMSFIYNSFASLYK